MLRLRSTRRGFPSKSRCQIKIIECFFWKWTVKWRFCHWKNALKGWKGLGQRISVEYTLWSHPCDKQSIFRHQSTPRMCSNKSEKKLGDLWRSNYLALSTHHHHCSFSMAYNENNDNNDTIMRRGMIAIQRLLYGMEMERMKEKRYISPFPHIGSICISGQLLCGEGSFCKPFIFKVPTG